VDLDHNDWQSAPVILRDYTVQFSGAINQFTFEKVKNAEAISSSIAGRTCPRLRFNLFSVIGFSPQQAGPTRVVGSANVIAPQRNPRQRACFPKTTL
jgi:hypothetical protein